MIGGVIDIRRKLRDLASRTDSPLDDGRVKGHVSPVDVTHFEKREKPPKGS